MLNVIAKVIESIRSKICIAITNLYDFNRHNSEQQTALVWQYGEFLTVRLDGECSVCLYNMGKFFAEIGYRPADNEIELVRGFTRKAMLEPYLALVDLKELTD